MCFCQLHSVGCQLSQLYHCAWPLPRHAEKQSTFIAVSQASVGVLKLALKRKARLFVCSCYSVGQSLASLVSLLSL